MRLTQGWTRSAGRFRPAIEIKTVLNRTQLVNSTIETVATNLGEGAFLVILVLFVMLGNFRAAFITALVIPVAMLMTATGMLQGRISANLMSLGAIDFGLIVDGAVIITENALRHLAERQAAAGRLLSTSERLQTVQASAEEMIGPSVYGQAIIILVYLPLLTFSGVEGKMFEPMALTVIFALIAAFVLSLTLVPALIAIFVTNRVSEGDNFAVRSAEDRLCAVAPAHHRPSAPGHRHAPYCCLPARCFCSFGSVRSSSRRWMKRIWRCMRCGYPAPA